jgi:tetratricopeptide (TPR) repeat protein
MQLLRELAWRERPAIAWWFFSYRSGPGTDAVDPFDQWGTPHLPTKVLDVAGLPDVEAEELARRLGTPATAVGTVVRESGGYPFFVSELARYLQSQPGPVSPPSVAAVVEARVSALPAEARHLLEYLSLATDPLPPDLLRALLPVPSAGEAVAALERAGLVRFGSDRERGLAYEPQHDRIREAVSASIPGQVLRERHAALGRVLETASATASKLAFHYRAAGDVDNGLRFTLDAARESAGALAFDEAAALLRTAIALHPPPVPWRLHRDLAEALVNAGQCSAGGAAYHAAAQAASAQGEGQDTVRRLSRCAGEQYLYGGQIEDGRGLLREALRAQGIRTPRWPLISSAVLRMRFLMRRSAATPPAVAAVPEARREMVDALWNTAKGTVMVEHVLGDCYALQALFAALQVGDPSRLIPPLGHEAVSQANIGGEFLRKRSFQILEETARLVALVPTPYNRGWLSLCRGAVAFFEGRWRDASAELTAASETFRVSCVGAVYEYAVASTFLLSALLYEGRFRELETLQPALQRWARERGNIYAEAMFASGNTSYLYLAQDAPARAIEEADRVLAAWGATRFTSQHYYHFVATVSARLYQGEGWEAWRRVVATWPQLRRAHFLTLDCIGVQLRDLRARAALAAAAAGPPPADLRAWTRRRLLDAAQGESRRIRRSQLPHARPTAAVVRACVHAARGGVAQARQAFSEAAHGFDSAAMPHLREAVRLRAAELSPEGAATLDDSGAQAAAALREMGVARPERLAAVMVPLEQRPRPALNPGLRESAAAPPPPP